MNTIEHSTEPERAFLVGISIGDQDEHETGALLDELAELTGTYGAEVVGRRAVKLRRPQPRLLLGSGNADQIVNLCRAEGVSLLIFDDELSPNQQRNWETLAGIRVIDRCELILAIFAARASTKEAHLQIQLAQAEHMLPRLKRAWTHLSRQRGGSVGQRGEGEQQLEVDGRLLKGQITKLRRQIAQVRRRRGEQRKQRRKVPVPNAAIVGYTNSGKSTLLNRLTEADVLVEDKLFATLDPTTRKLRLGNNQTLLLTDTVGFVRKLPHGLVEAFKATLEETLQADFLILLTDASSPDAEEQMKTTRQVLREIGAADKDVILVFNKTDCVDAPHVLSRLRRRHAGAVLISAQTGDGIPELMDAMKERLDLLMEVHKFRIPPNHYQWVAYLHRTGDVKAETFEDDVYCLTAAVPSNCLSGLTEFVVNPE